MSLVQSIGCGFALYTVAGLCTAAAFVAIFLQRALPQQASYTLGARLVLLPGAAALWPYVVWRLLKARRR
jgi:hypothetical protein